MNKALADDGDCSMNILSLWTSDFLWYIVQMHLFMTMWFNNMRTPLHCTFFQIETVSYRIIMFSFHHPERVVLWCLHEHFEQDEANSMSSTFGTTYLDVIAHIWYYGSCREEMHPLQCSVFALLCKTIRYKFLVVPSWIDNKGNAGHYQYRTWVNQIGNATCA